MAHERSKTETSLINDTNEKTENDQMIRKSLGFQNDDDFPGALGLAVKARIL
jgi:hypothetical protein